MNTMCSCSHWLDFQGRNYMTRVQVLCHTWSTASTRPPAFWALWNGVVAWWAILHHHLLHLKSPHSHLWSELRCQQLRMALGHLGHLDRVRRISNNFNIGLAEVDGEKLVEQSTIPKSMKQWLYKTQPKHHQAIEWTFWTVELHGRTAAQPCTEEQ